MIGNLDRRTVLAGLAAASVAPRCFAKDVACRDYAWLLGHRRMVRKFTGGGVSDEQVTHLLETATRAPSAGHLQPWAFVVVRDAERRRRLGVAAFGQEWLAAAPVSIIACADPSRARARYGERADRYAVIDTSFASLLLLLAATEMGLGACFVGAFDDTRVRDVLGHPSHVQPLAIIPIGHPAEAPTAMRRRPLADVVHTEQW